ncbi:MAG: hypothetical protein EOO27_02300 [Comamonadaceae bacterium]|nr:MAG: hypothetical protein EOO27_02300 [Comamonadaceae bacterium]
MPNLKDYQEITDLFTPQGIKDLKVRQKEAKPFDMMLAFEKDGKKTDYKVVVKGQRVYAQEVVLGDPEYLGVEDVKELPMMPPVGMKQKLSTLCPLCMVVDGHSDNCRDKGFK